MEWEDKVKMIQLGNQMNNYNGSKTDFQNCVLEHIDTFDGQAWDMFVELVEIIPTEMKEDIDFWSQIYNRMKNVDCNDEKFGLRSGMRIALIQTLCEEDLKLGDNIIKENKV